MASRVFTVLYTHQKTKKSKVWQDGILKTSSEGSNATLFSDKGQRLDSVFLKVGAINPGDDLESDRYLITVEAEDIGSEVPQGSPEVRLAPQTNRNMLKPVGLRPPVGLKRKFTGFQGPREILKKPSLELEDVCKPSSPVLGKDYPALPSQLYATSPLFSAPCKQSEEGSMTAHYSSHGYKTSSVKCEKQDVAESLALSSDFSALQKTERDNIAGANKGGLSITQNIRSTAQILSLLKSHPSHIKNAEPSRNPDHQQSPKSSAKVLNSSYSSIPCGLDGEGHKQQQHTPELSTIKNIPMKSRWDVYLEKPQNSCAEKTFLTTLSEDIWDTKSACPSVKTDSSFSVLKSDGQEQGLQSNTSLPAPVECLMQNLPISISSKSENGSENMKRSNNFQAVKFLSFDDPSNSSTQKCFSGEITGKTDVSGLPSPSDGQQLALQTEIEDETPSEVTFNLVDSFDFGYSDEENTSPKLSHLPARCVDRDDVETERGVPGKISALSDNENVKISGFNYDNPPLYKLDHKKQENKLGEVKASVSDDDLGDRNVRKIDFQQDDLSFSSADMSVSQLFDETHKPTAFSRNSNVIELNKIMKESEDNIQVLENRTEVEGRAKTYQGGLSSAAVLHQESLINSKGDLLEHITGSPSNKETNWENTDLPDLPHSKNGISLLKTLTTPSTALESLSLLKRKLPPAFQEKECARRTSPQNTQGEVPHRPSSVELSLGFSDMGQEVSSFNEDVGFPQTPSSLSTLTTSLPMLPLSFQEPSSDSNRPSMSCEIIHPVEFQGHRVKGSASSAAIFRSPNSVVQCCEFQARSPYGNHLFELAKGFRSPMLPTGFTINDLTQQSSVSTKDGDIQTELNLTVSPQDEDKQYCVPRWIVGSQDLDCDWTLSQWPSRELNKVFSPVQRESPGQVFLRPRQENHVEKGEHELADVRKTFKLEAGIQSGEPVVAGLDMPQSLNRLDHVHAFLGNHTSFSSACPLVTGDKNNDIKVARSVKDNNSLTQPENCCMPSNARPSKWAKYQSLSRNTSESNTMDWKEDDFCAQSVFEKSPQTLQGRQINNVENEHSAHLNLSNTLGFPSSDGTGARREILTKNLTKANCIAPHLGKKSLCFSQAEDGQIVLSSDLCFPSKESVLSVSLPKRKIRIPAAFQSTVHYKQVFTASLTEHLNIVMFELSQRLHWALSKVDISFYTSQRGEDTQKKDGNAPLCLHHQPAKLVMVKKEGPNKGRFFYACEAPKADQCKFFKWMDEVKCNTPVQGKPDQKAVMGDMKSLSAYIRCQNIALYEESQLMIRKVSGFHQRHFSKFKKIANAGSRFGDESKTKLYLKLNRKDSSSAYSKDDLWIISKTLFFEPLDTFIACSAFFGPSANNDIEIVPLKGYHPSNWPTNMVVHALLACNASTELTSLRNLQEHVNPTTLPLMPHLLTMNSKLEITANVGKGRFNPPTLIGKATHNNSLPNYDFVINSATSTIKQFGLNKDQAAALMQIAKMIAGADGPQNESPITIIHGVFGAGKSYLLAVVVLFLAQMFENCDLEEGSGSSPWKILISSSTNIAVDRVLLGLLDLKFDRFIRVGSIRKIAKPVLPHSLHSGSENESEQLKELLGLLKEDLTPAERMYVKKSIEQHKLGTNKTLLGQVRVVGATCASCPFTCLSHLKFPIVILDECSQMTEPASMLPVARFQCEKLILVGDPKQLSPTVQGSEATHEHGLEQTLFDRLCLMGHKAVLLRTQYRCHPAISAIADEMFYGGLLLNGVSEEHRAPLLDWLPTLCFFNANGTEQVEGSNSFHNVEEANFTVKLIQCLIASGINGCMIGVITLYKAQMYKICTLLGSATLCDPMETKAVQVSTVDAFQGAEKEIIILSCVRTKQVGFIDSEKRMNVAITRGKRHLLIIGSLACLRRNKLWEHVIHHCGRQTNGLKHVSQWEEKLNAILNCYQEKKLEVDSNVQKKEKKKSKTKEGKVNQRLDPA
ncbi:protein ZGRF1 [Spea bombifrons]|uniref:protein ZGRF1 n=1 Tax=Spea bombifrons TaxID=233779 RepID=UPI002349D277|nr:protein ZGRF1 [Spea bombifrons]